MAYSLHLLISIGIMLLLALSLQWILVLADRLSLGHVAFYGLGAYTVAMATVGGTMGLLPALLLALLLTLVASLLVGAAALRVRGDIFAFTTLLFHWMTIELLHHVVPLTGGPFGISAIPRPALPMLDLDLPWGSLVLVLLALGWVLFVGRKLHNSPLGEALKEMHADPLAARLAGDISPGSRLFIFVIGSMTAGLAGGLYATYASYVEPALFGLVPSMLLLVVLLLAGTRSPLAVIGATLLLVGLRELFRLVPFAPDTLHHLYGILLGLLLMALAIGGGHRLASARRN